MNKRQEMDVMIMRAKMNIEEVLKQHDAAWNGQDPEIIEGEEEGDNDGATN